MIRGKRWFVVRYDETLKSWSGIVATDDIRHANLVKTELDRAWYAKGKTYSNVDILDTDAKGYVFWLQDNE